MNHSIFKTLRNKIAFILLGVFALITTNSFAQDAAATVAEEGAKAPVGPIIWFYLLLALTGILIFAVISKVVKVLELTYELNGKQMNIKWNKINGVLMFLFMFAFLGGTLWEMNTHGRMLLPESASEHGLLTDRLFNITLIITGFVFVVTHIFLFWFAYKYRGSEKNKKAYFYPHNDKLEVYWTVIPAIVLTVLVISGWKTWTDITKPAPKDAIQLDVVAEQFLWNVRYAGADGKLGTKTFKLVNDVNKTGIDFNDKNAKDDFMATEIYLPVGKPVNFNFGARDVIHSAYMPHFRAQMNCVPGMPTLFWFTPRTTTAEMREKLNDPKFDYILMCAKICGSAHYNMKMNIVVVTEAEYKEWLGKQKPYYTEDMAKMIEEAQQAREKSDAEHQPKKHHEEEKVALK
jgi:cytochrome c oxidase subunit II